MAAKHVATDSAFVMQSNAWRSGTWARFRTSCAQEGEVYLAVLTAPKSSASCTDCIEVVAIGLYPDLLQPLAVCGERRTVIMRLCVAHISDIQEYSVTERLGYHCMVINVAKLTVKPTKMCTRGSDDLQSQQLTGHGASGSSTPVHQHRNAHLCWLRWCPL